MPVAGPAALRAHPDNLNRDKIALSGRTGSCDPRRCRRRRCRRGLSRPALFAGPSGRTRQQPRDHGVAAACECILFQCCAGQRVRFADELTFSACAAVLWHSLRLRLAAAARCAAAHTAACMTSQLVRPLVCAPLGQEMTLPAMQRGCHLVTSLIQREIASSLQGIKVGGWMDGCSNSRGSGTLEGRCYCSLQPAQHDLFIAIHSSSCLPGLCRWAWPIFSSSTPRPRSPSTRMQVG